MVRGVAGGRAGEQEVAGLQLDDARRVGDELLDAVDDVVDALVLTDPSCMTSPLTLSVMRSGL